MEHLEKLLQRMADNVRLCALLAEVIQKQNILKTTLSLKKKKIKEAQFNKPNREIGKQRKRKSGKSNKRYYTEVDLRKNKVNNK